MPATELDHLGVPVFRLAVSDTGDITYDSWNSVAEKLTGRPSAEVRGLTAEQVFGGRFGRIAGERQAKVAERKEKSTHRITLPTVEGDREFQTTLTPQFENGRVRYIWGIWCDVSLDAAQREADALRLVALEEAEQFLTMAAHDLRSPMRNVRVLTEALLEDFTDLGDGKRDLLVRIDTLAERASKLIADVLAQSGTAHAQEATATEFGLDELCLDIFGVLDPQQRHDLAADPARIIADRVTVQIVIRNLVDNAIKHGGTGHLDLQVRAVPLGDMMALEVEDDGKGFDDPAIAFLGGGAFRYDSGFGLFGLRRLVEARGGTIQARHSKTGGGLVRVVMPGQVLAPVTGADLPQLTQDVIS